MTFPMPAQVLESRIADQLRHAAGAIAASLGQRRFLRFVVGWNAIFHEPIEKLRRNKLAPAQPCDHIRHEAQGVRNTLQGKPRRCAANGDDERAPGFQDAEHFP